MPNREATINARDLATTWRTLRAVAHNYELGSPAEANLAAARKLIAAEVRAQHGVDAWTDMVEGGSPDVSQSALRSAATALLDALDARQSLKPPAVESLRAHLRTTIAAAATP